MQNDIKIVNIFMILIHNFAFFFRNVEINTVILIYVMFILLIALFLISFNSSSLSVFYFYNYKIHIQTSDFCLQFTQIF